MDTQTRHALKGDKFAQATKTSVSWISENRSGFLRWTITIVVALILGIGSVILYNVRASAAEAALGAALDTYATPLAVPGQPAQAGVYTAAADRAKDANKQFQAVADKYGWLPEGTKAHYFAGVTDQDLGQAGAAESELKTAAGAWDRNVANLAKLALAGLYHQTNRDSQAVDLYNAIIAKPSDTVSAGVAQLGLADLFVAEGKQDQARALWAKLKESDKDGTAGSIAAQKLAGGGQ